MEIDYTKVTSYGDTLNDGVVQLSFTLPLPLTEEAKEGAKLLAGQMGLREVQIYHAVDLGENFSFFIVYGKTNYTVDITKIHVPKIVSKKLDFYAINEKIKKEIGRKLVVVGACTGSDAHTVGIDAIMNMKGYNGEYGLERYPMFEAYNLGAQVSNESLIAKVKEVQADVILVSQVVTQKGVHLTNLTELVELLEADGLREKVILIVGGPRITHNIALELGYDAGFGPGTVASDVASYIVEEFILRKLK